MRLLSLVDNEVVATLGHDAVQVPERIAVVPDVLAIVHLQELAWGAVFVLGRPDVVLAHAVVATLVHTNNGGLDARHGVNEVDSFDFEV